MSQTLHTCIAAALTVVTVAGFAQTPSHTVFTSVGRGAPLAVTLDPAASPAKLPFVGPLRLAPVLFPGATAPVELLSARDGASPKGVTPLKVDLYTSMDFYADRTLWSDPGYCRCKCPVGSEALGGG